MPYKNLLGKEGTWMVGIQEDRMEVYDSEMITGTAGDWTGFFDNRENKVLDTGTERITSVFTQIKHKFNDQWIGNWGVRFDKKWRHKGGTLDEVSPRIAFIYIPSDMFDVKVSYSKAFVDAPYWYRYNSLPSYMGADSLKPELMNSYQLAPTLRLANGKIVSSLNLFYSRFSDFIWRNNNPPPGEGEYQNGGLLKVRGIENETSYRGGGWNWTLNLTYQEAADAKDYEAVSGHRMWNIPNFNANFVFNVNPFELLNFIPKSVSNDLWFNLTARYIGEQLSPIDITFPNGTEFNEPNKEVDDVVLFNTGFRWNKLWKSFFLDTRVYNLLDEKYYQGGSVSHPYPQPGRWFMITLGYQGKW
jgi:iron complex outermembrane receptor protein